MPIMKKPVRSYFVASLFLSLIGASLACRFGLPALQTTPTATPQPVPRLDQLIFDDPATEARFKALDQCTNEMMDANWRTSSYQLIGNFYESKWCAGSGARQDCQIAASTQDNRDQRAISLSTLFYYDSLPNVFGLNFNSFWVPPTTGWGALFYFSEQGGNIVGEGWGVTFRNYTEAAGEAKDSISLGSRYQYEIIPTTIEVTADASPRDDLANYLKSAEAMRDAGLKQLQALADKVIGSLQNHQITGCDYAPYQGNGIPPACTPRRMTVEEESAEIQKARAYFDTQTRLLSGNYKDMYAAWMQSFPFDACWH